jgi:hypothetical protein
MHAGKQIAFAALAILVALVLWRARASRAPRAQPTMPPTSSAGLEPKQSCPAPRARAFATATQSLASSTESQTGGEPVDSPELCETICGSECVAANGALRCPPRCRRDSDCADGALCIFTRMSDPSRPPARRCLGSECVAAKDCGPGRTCRPMARTTGAINRCYPTGVRALNESCLGEDPTVPPDALCAPGMHCSMGVCAPDRCSEDHECPKGEKCIKLSGIDARTCESSCSSDSDCPAEKRCVAGFSLGTCVDRSVPRTCLEDGCSDGATCVVLSPLAWSFQAVCVTPCSGVGDTGCRSGQVCASSNLEDPTKGPFSCKRSCSPGAGGGCPVGWQCEPIAGNRSVCEYDMDAMQNREFLRYKHR